MPVPQGLVTTEIINRTIWVGNNGVFVPEEYILDSMVMRKQHGALWLRISDTVYV